MPNADLIELIWNLAWIAIALVAGTVIEKRHYKSIRKREKELANLPASTLRKVPFDEGEVLDARMVTGSVVVSTDLFKRILSFFEWLVGGRVSAYEPLLDRARREAILRMKEEARGSSLILGVRVDSSPISSHYMNGFINCVEIIASGTAVTLGKQHG